MPGTPEHPVTLGDLRVFIDPPVTNAQQMVTTRWTRPATIADLVSALRAEGVLVVERVDGEWAEWARVAATEGCIRRTTDPNWVSEDILDALAEAQP